MHSAVSCTARKRPTTTSRPAHLSVQRTSTVNRAHQQTRRFNSRYSFNKRSKPQHKPHSPSTTNLPGSKPLQTAPATTESEKPTTKSFKHRLAVALGYAVEEPPDYDPKKLFPEHSPQFTYPTTMPGNLVYSLDKLNFDKLRNADIIPGSTILASLSALSFWNWDAIGSGVWVVSAMAGAWGLYGRSLNISRISVEVDPKQKDKFNYPRTAGSTVHSITNVVIEEKNFPFCQPRIKKLPIIGLQRIYDPSYLKYVVTVDDIADATAHPGYESIQLQLGKERLIIAVDQIRDIDYMNQLLARAHYDENNV